MLSKTVSCIYYYGCVIMDGVLAGVYHTVAVQCHQAGAGSHWLHGPQLVFNPCEKCQR